MESTETLRKSPLRRRADRILNFLRRDLWLLPAPKGVRRPLLRLLRMTVLATEGFFRSDATTLAAALTFKVVFALVPLLAVMLAILKGFGGLSNLTSRVKQSLIHYVIPNIGNQVTSQIDTFVENISAAAIGVVGFVLLAYTAISLLDTVEKAFNRIWGVRAPRPILRRVTIFWTLLTLAPIFLALSMAMSTFVFSHSLYLWLMGYVPLLGTATLALAPFLFAWFLFTAVYLIMPNANVKVGAAFTGAVVAGTLWELSKTAYVWYNARFVSSYTFYGSLGAIPVFLLWIYLGWIIVLLGSEIAFAAQHERTYRREIENINLRQNDRERLALLLCVHVARPFASGGDPPDAEAVAARLNTPSRLVHEITLQLTSAGILRETSREGRRREGLVPGRDPAALTVRDVLEALRGAGDPLTLPDGREAAALYKLVDDANERAAAPLAAVTIKDLAAGIPS